ncbi:MAG: cobalt ECF transporter T component CbiQ [Pseudomonadota bacterium]
MGHLARVERGTLHEAEIDDDHGPVGLIDPRARILGAVVFAAAVIGLSDLVVLCVALALSVLVMLTAKLPAGATLRRMAAMDSFIVFMLVMLPFTVPGTPFVHVFGWPASIEGLRQAIEIALKANAIVLMLMALVGTMEPVTLGHALHRLRVPVALVHLLMFTVRYVGVLHQEYGRLRASMKTRGFRPRNSRHTYRTFGYLVGMMLVRAIERSERILDAMKCRGFDGRLPLLDNFAFGPRDAAFAALLVATVFGLHLLEVAVAGIA